MSDASEVELLMLGLINQERTSRGLDPLAINNDLNETAEDHSQWMLATDTFSHTGVGGSGSGDRIAASGYQLQGNWRTAENIGWQSERGAPGIADDVSDIHAGLMASPGHRANILNPELEDIGIGIEQGDFRGFDGVVITQNFGRTAAISDTSEGQNAPIVTSELATPSNGGVTPAFIEEVAEVVDELPFVEPVEPPENDDSPPVATDPNPGNDDPTTDTAAGRPSVEIDGDGSVVVESPATEEDTVAEVADGSPLTGAPAQEAGDDETVPSVDLAAFFEGFFAWFDFANLPALDHRATDLIVVLGSERASTTSHDVVSESKTTDISAGILDVFTTSCFAGADYMDFG